MDSNTALLNQLLTAVLDLKASFEKHMDALEQRVDEHDKHFDRIEKQLETQQQDILCIKTILELNIRSDVSIIAENYLNLDTKLNLILKQSEGNEQLKLRVNYLDSEVRKIKGHLKLA